MTFANIDANDKNELVKRFFRLSWSTKRYHDIVKIIGGYRDIPSDLPYLHPSCFLYGQERKKMNLKDLAYDAVCIFFNTSDPNKSIDDLDPQLKKQLRDFKYEKVYDIYNSRMLFLAHKKNPKIVGANKGGRIFIDGKNYVYYNPEYPLSFDENARMTDLPFTLLASELIKIVLFADSNTDVGMREMLDFAHLTTISQNLQSVQKYSYLVLYEMISKLKHRDTFAEKITNRYISSFQSLRAKRNTCVKEPVYQDMHNFDFLYTEESKQKFIQEERNLSSLKGMIEELTGTPLQQMSSQEFEKMQSQENSSVFCNTYVHVEDNEELIDRLYYFDEEGRETLVDEATRFYPLGYEEKMFVFVHYVESIYNVATELAKKEDKTLETSFQKIDYLKDKGYLSKEEAEKFKEYYLPLRNKLAHENIPFSNNEDEETNKDDVWYLTSYERKLRNLTQVNFYREYKENIEVELGGIYHRLEEKLISPEERHEILNKNLRRVDDERRRDICQQILGGCVSEEELSKIDFSSSSKHPVEISSKDGCQIVVHFHSEESLDKRHEKFFEELGIFAAPRTPVRISAQISSKKNSQDKEQK